MAKLSMVVLYSRTLSKIFLWGLGVWIFLWALGTYLDVFLECRHLHNIWTAECAPSFATSVSTGVLNVLNDLAILIFRADSVEATHADEEQNWPHCYIFVRSLVS